MSEGLTLDTRASSLHPLQSRSRPAERKRCGRACRPTRETVKAIEVGHTPSWSRNSHTRGKSISKCPPASRMEQPRHGSTDAAGTSDGERTARETWKGRQQRREREVWKWYPRQRSIQMPRQSKFTLAKENEVGITPRQDARHLSRKTTGVYVTDTDDGAAQVSSRS